MSVTLDKFLSEMPGLFNAQTNPVIHTLLEAWAGQCDDVLTQLDNTKAQIFVATASGSFLEKLGANLGVERPTQLVISDDTYSKLIPNLSFKPKQIFKAFYDTMDVFWGPLFSRANITGSANAPFAVSVGDTFTITVDNINTKSITVKTGDIAANGAATAAEMVDILNQIPYITASIATQTDGNERINIRTNTPGLRGALALDATNNFPGLGFDTSKTHVITDLSQRTVAYVLNNDELILEIPAFVPVLRYTLKGSHHFHANATLNSPIPPANGIWQGGFIFSRTQNQFVPTKSTAILDQNISSGAFLNKLTVTDTSNLPPSGKLVIDFGKGNQEYGIEYFSILNSNTIEIDPSRKFQNDHFAGAVLNYQAANLPAPYMPRKTGVDFAAYLPSEVSVRQVVQQLLQGLAAAGVLVNFVIILPEYDYTIYNPFNAVT